MKRVFFALFILATVNWIGAVQTQYSDFQKVSYSLPFAAEITIADNYSVELDGADEVKEKIEIVQTDKELSLRWKEKNNRSGYRDIESWRKKVKVRISMPNLEALNVAGSGDVVVKNTVKTANFTCNLAGSGDVRIESVAVTTAKFNIAGSGNVSVSGTATDVAFNVAGSGDISAKNLKAQNVDCNVSGSGNISCVADAQLKASVMGSGDITYSGSATNVQQNVRGSGSVTRR